MFNQVKKGAFKALGYQKCKKRKCVNHRRIGSAWCGDCIKGNGLLIDKATYPRWYKLFLWMWPTQQYVTNGDVKVLYKQVFGKTYVTKMERT